MKTLLTFIGRIILCGLLLCMTLASFFIGYIYVNENYWIWLAATLVCLASFLGAIAIGIMMVESDDPESTSAPKAQTRSEYNTHTTRIKTA